MARKKQQAPTGAPDWLVTFGDLMSILVCFFVLIISFSIQDQQKMQVVAGSMRDAFGVKMESRKAGVIEVDGMIVRENLKMLSSVEKEMDAEFSTEQNDQRRKQGPEANTHDIEKADIERPRQFATAAASLRQAWQEHPEITELSSSLMVEETPEGLAISLVDQEGRSMFPQSSKHPYEHTRQLLTVMAPVLRKMPNRIKITGHTDANNVFENPNYTNWDLSADRANTVRRILSQNGIPQDRFFSVEGKADTEPLFPDDVFLSANRRVTILIMPENPPLSPNHKL
jgi:chemotaxis protein MotB